MHINFYATLRPIVGGKTIEQPLPAGTTVLGMIDLIIARFPALYEQLYEAENKLYPHIHIFINGRDAQHLDNGWDTVIGPDDTVNIFPPVGGG
jgi:molybdopterin synthase sulfur carrier subunit